MSQFTLDNGKSGVEKAWHTSTGYGCAVTHPWNSGDEAGRVTLFIRHIVGTDGMPYVEAGVTGLEDHEKSDAISDFRRCLNQGGFSEVQSLHTVVPGIRAFMHQEPLSFDSVSVRVKVADEENGIVAVIGALKNLVHEAAARFIVEQETVPDVLYQSILGVMGEELDKGPGGHEHAVEVAKRLAAEFQRGLLAQDQAVQN